MKRLLILFLLHTFSTHSESVITNKIEQDGFGSQFQNIISTVMYAELNNKEYVYTPFQTMAHNYINTSGFLEKKETLINFMNHFKINKGLTVKPQIRCKIFCDNNIAACSKTNALKKIKMIFRENKKIDDFFDNEHFHIAIHIRRANSHDNRFNNASDEVHLKIINELRKKYSSDNVIFHIYSQGKRETFELFNGPNTIFHLDEPLEKTFTEMVFADVLVTCASSLSYIAGFLSEGTVYYMPFWHKPFPQWIILDCPKQTA